MLVGLFTSAGHGVQTGMQTEGYEHERIWKLSYEFRYTDFPFSKIYVRKKIKVKKIPLEDVSKEMSEIAQAGYYFCHVSILYVRKHRIAASDYKPRRHQFTTTKPMNSIVDP